VVALGAALVPSAAVSAVRGHPSTPIEDPAHPPSVAADGARSRRAAGRPAGLACPVAVGSGRARRRAWASPVPLVLACVCHPGCTSARCGSGSGLPGPARLAAWCGAARAGCARARGRWLIRPAIPVWARPCWASACPRPLRRAGLSFSRPSGTVAERSFADIFNPRSAPAAAYCREVVAETASARETRPMLAATLGMLHVGDTRICAPPTDRMRAHGDFPRQAQRRWAR
jgi:hypothetical protein